MQHVKISHSDAYTSWHISRPERGNGLGPSLYAELDKCLDETLNRDPICLFISSETCGKNRPVAIAGGDLKELASITSPEEAMQFSKTASHICNRIASLSFPVVILVDGDVLGGGVEFLSVADMVLATSRSEFHFAQLLVGLTSGFGGNGRLLKSIGISRLKHAFLTAAVWSSAEAKEAGLIHEVYSTLEEVTARQKQLIDLWRRSSPSALRGQKKLLNNEVQTLAKDLEAFGGCWMQKEHKAYLKKFSAKGSMKQS